MVSKSAHQHYAGRIYEAVFANAPCPFLVLTPELQIVEANEAYLSATSQLRDALVARDMFEAFPDNPDDPLADGVANLSDSFERALRSGARDLMPLQRYDVQDSRGRWRVKYWRPANWPVFEDGRLIAVVHHVMDVTEQALAQVKAPAPDNLNLIDRADLALDVARRLNATAKQDLAQIRGQHELWLRTRKGGLN
jgi:PAS domain-containing protein